MFRENVWESQFLKNFGILFYQNKPSNITWSKYYYVLNDQPIPIVYEESSTELADLATRTGDLGLLYSISQQNPSIFPSIEAINMAAREGYLDVLKQLAQQNPRILPNIKGTNDAARAGHLDILKWLAQQKPPILPDRYGASFAKSGGHMDIVKWLAQRNPPILPFSENELIVEEID